MRRWREIAVVTVTFLGVVRTAPAESIWTK